MPVSSLKLRTINEAKRFLTTQFRDADIETADIDARLLLMQAAGLTRAELIAGSQNALSQELSDQIQTLAARRIDGDPIDHILGYREFYGRRFKVTKDVLSPRPETEMLVETALKVTRSQPNVDILDLGTGSGAIIISIMAEASMAQATAIDTSEAALKIARENAKIHGVDARIDFLNGSWFRPVKRTYDIIISNPPYITRPAMEALSIEVKDFDPPLALSGGEDGLDAYREIITEAKTYLNPNGIILLEIGFDQGASVAALLKEAGFTNIVTEQDLAGHDRMVRGAG